MSFYTVRGTKYGPICPVCLCYKHGNEIWNTCVTRANHSEPKNISPTCNLTLKPISSTPSSAPEHPKVLERDPSFLPSSNSLEIKAFLVVGESRGLQQATAGLLLEENREGRRRIYWKPLADLPTCRASGEGDPSPTAPTARRPSPSSRLHSGSSTAVQFALQR